MMRYLLLCILAAGLVYPLQAQDEADTLVGWRKGGTLGINFNQIAVNNWVAGGQNAITITTLANFNAKYKRDRIEWESTLDLAYGLNRREAEGTQKTDDKIDLASKLGYSLGNKWFLTGLLNFKSQFAAGFNYPNDSVKISDFMAPGYLTVSAGFDYKPSDFFSVYLSPLTGKFTFVNNTQLSNDGAFGVDPGDKFRAELGGYIRIQLNKDIWENVNLQTRAEFFSNYSENPGNIDVFWETLISMKVNDFLSASITATLIYDDDILIDKNGDGTATSPGTQFKEVLGIGLNYKFGN